MIQKIKTKEEKERKQRRNQILLGGGLIILMILSTAGFSLMNDEERQGSTKKEKGIEFISQNGYWIALINERVTRFQYLPSEVEEIKVEGTHTINEYSGSTIYFIGTNEGTTEILVNLNDYILRYQEACLKGEECQGDLPTKDCSEKIIISIPGNENKVYREENCVYLMGDPIKSSDAWLYKMFGIN